MKSWHVFFLFTALALVLCSAALTMHQPAILVALGSVPSGAVGEPSDEHQLPGSGSDSESAANGKCSGSIVQKQRPSGSVAIEELHLGGRSAHHGGDDAAFDAMVRYNPSTSVRITLEKKDGSKREMLRKLAYLWPPCLHFDCERGTMRCSPPADGKDAQQWWAQPTFGSPGKENQTAAMPCCLHLLKDLLVGFGEELFNAGIPFFAHYGTLLGIVRGQGLIPWTGDVDIAVALDAWQALDSNTELRRKMFDRGFVTFTEHSGAGKMGRVCFGEHFANGSLLAFPFSGDLARSNYMYLDHFPYMDVYTIRESAGGQLATNLGPCHYSKSDLSPFGMMHKPKTLDAADCLQDATVLRAHNSLSQPFRSVFVPEFGACIPLPHAPLSVVEHTYGKAAWLHPPPKKNMHGENTHKCSRR